MVEFLTIPDFSGQPWPPKADCERLARYAIFAKYFKGDHISAFRYLGAQPDEGLRRKIYLIANFPGLITRACADFLCGEPPKFLAAGGPTLEQEDGLQMEDPVQQALDELVKASKLTRVLYQAEVAASHKGDAFLRVRDTGARVIIEQVKPDSCFAVLDPDNCNEALYLFVAWIHQAREKSPCYLRVEVHFPGVILQQAYRLAGPGATRVGQQVDLAEVYGAAAPPELAYTGVEEPLLIHIPNFEGGDSYWGPSDYHDLETLFEAINNRLSKIDAYLDKHSAPKLVGLPGTLDEQGNVDAKKLEYVEPENPEIGKYLPRYVTWDGNMTGAFLEIEHLKDLIFQIGEMAPAIFGLDKAGSIESGRAMMLRFIRTAAKITRKRMFFDPAVKLALTLAMRLQFMRYGGADLAEREIDIAWQDGIPQDYTEAVNAEVARVTAGLSSAQKAIERIDGLTPAEARAELARIAGEKKSGGTNGTESEPSQPGAGEGGTRAEPGPAEAAG